jgi:two-component system chemotaxis response regulator CheB
MIVDDSAVMRQVLSATLSEQVGIEVIGVASDPIFALEKMCRQWPDVIVLDVEMPRMDGISFLNKLMAEHPTPVVICSSLTEKGADVTMQAFAAGALSVITKPMTGLRDFIHESSSDMASAIRAAAQARLSCLPPPVGASSVTLKPAVNKPASRVDMMMPDERRGAPKLSADAMLKAPSGLQHLPTTEKIIALGTSTGGTQALEAVLTALPATVPGMVIVQHMPEKFTQSFANRLDSLSRVEVREAKNHDRILPGRAMIAPGGKHMLVKRNGAQYHVEVVDGPLVSRHRPSVDVLFRSVAQAAGKNAIGIIMTGMGDDGARGLKELQGTGAITYAQDEASCVVFGMPKEAIALGGVSEIVPLECIANIIERYGR